MPSFNKSFGFTQSPFEQYVAENEPEILEYAVTPPYFEVARRRSFTPSTHILFGARGAGKSATRLATEKEIWRELAEKRRAPLPVSFVDFSYVLDARSVEGVTVEDLVSRIAFLTVEAILLWLTDEEDGIELGEALDEVETVNFVALSKAFYLSKPEAQRRVSQEIAMQLLQQNWRSKTSFWVNRRWSNIAKLIAKVTSSFMSAKFDTEDISREVEALITENGSVASNSVVLSRTVAVTRSFGFDGISIFVDKVDEHEKTQSSPEKSAQLIHPLISQVQLMEIDGLGFQFFLWDRIKPLFGGDKYAVRLDKLPEGEVQWTEDFLKKMLDERMAFFSDGKVRSIGDICQHGVDGDAYLTSFISLAGSSPRELIRLMDILTAQYDIAHAANSAIQRLSLDDFEKAMDRYVQDRVWSIYDRGILSQILRLDLRTFINKDVQQAFRISAGKATNRIQKWISCGAVRQVGTRAASGDSGGKPSNEYGIADPRIARLADRKLYDSDALTEAPLDADESA